MHFLSHYYTALPAEHPLFVAAALIPDLTRGFSKIYNSMLKNALIPDNRNPAAGPGDLHQIHAGILAHYEADKKFHNSPLFMQQVSLATKSFLSEGLNRERLRLSVIAHLTIEMMIDRQIILENEDLCVKFYSTIERADEAMLETYFNHFSLNLEKRGFLVNFSAFKQRQFLFLLKEPENIVRGLNRLYSSVAKTEFTEQEMRKFLAALHNIDGALRYSWQKILKE